MLAWKQDHEIFAVTMKDIEKALKSKQYIDSRSHVPEEYHDLLDMFEKKNANKLLSHKDYNIKIELKLEKMPNFEFLYSMSWEELQVLQQYLDEHLAKEFIWSSCSLFVSPVLFARKLREELCFCIDY